MTKYILIPDIQGDLAFLRLIIETYLNDKNNRFIFLGDVVGGKKFSKQQQLDSLNLTVNLMVSGRAIVFEGNHDIWCTHKLASESSYLSELVDKGEYRLAIKLIENMPLTERTFKNALITELEFASNDDKQARERFLTAMEDLELYFNSPNRLHAGQIGNFCFSHANWRPFLKNYLSSHKWKGLQATGELTPSHLNVISGMDHAAETTSREDAGLTEDEFWVSGHHYDDHKNDAPVLINDFNYMLDNGHGKNNRAKNIVGILRQKNGTWQLSYEDIDIKNKLNAA